MDYTENMSNLRKNKLQSIRILTNHIAWQIMMVNESRSDGGEVARKQA